MSNATAVTPAPAKAFATAFISIELADEPCARITILSADPFWAG
jgi:hypothetical protein